MGEDCHTHRIGGWLAELIKVDGNVKLADEHHRVQVHLPLA